MESWFILISVGILAVIAFRLMRGSDVSEERSKSRQSDSPDVLVEPVPTPDAVAPVSNDSFLEGLSVSLQAAEEAGTKLAEERANARTRAAIAEFESQYDLPEDKVKEIGLGDDLIALTDMALQLPIWIAIGRSTPDLNPLGFDHLVGKFASDPDFDVRQDEGDGSRAWPFPTGKPTEALLSITTGDPKPARQTWKDVRDVPLTKLNFSGDEEWDWQAVEFRWRGITFGVLSGPSEERTDDGTLTIRCLYEQDEPKLAISVETVLVPDTPEAYELTTVQRVLKVRRDGEWPKLLIAIRAHRAERQPVSSGPVLGQVQNPATQWPYPPPNV